VGDQIVGSAGLHSRVGDGGLEIGYWVHGDWTGRGIATNATAALTDAALALPGIERVEIYHDAANLASGRIPAKLGYARLGERQARDLGPAAPGETGTYLLAREAGEPVESLFLRSITVAERLKLTEVATLGRRHFSVVRPGHVDALMLLP